MDKRVGVLYEAFNDADKEQTGTLSKAELIEELKKLGIMTNNDEVKAALKTFDQKSEHVLDFGEFLVLLMCLSEKNPEYQKTIGLCGIGAGGKVTASQISAIMTGCGKDDVNDADIENWILAEDSDNDMKLNYKEFIRLMKMAFAVGETWP